jgi:hypothetical protein
LDSPHYKWQLKIDFGHQFCNDKKLLVANLTMIEIFSVTTLVVTDEGFPKTYDLCPFHGN